MAEPQQDEQEQIPEQLSELDSFAEEWSQSRSVPNDGSVAELENSSVEPKPVQQELQMDSEEQDTEVEEPEAVEEAATEQVEAKPVSSQPKKYTVPDDDIYGELRGKKATAAELEKAGLLDRLLTREHQELHHVKLYQGLKKEFDALKEQFAQPTTADQQAAQVQPEQFAEMLKGHYGPQLKQMAEAGAFEPDFLHVYPKVAVQMEHRFQSGGRALMGLVQQVHQLSEYVGMKQSEDATIDAKASVESKMDSLVEELPALADKDVRGRFVAWAVDENNPLTTRMATKDEAQLTAQDLRGAFAAYVAMTGDGLQVQKQPQRQQRQQRARMAAGGGSSGGGGGSSQTSTGTSELEDFEREFLGSR